MQKKMSDWSWTFALLYLTCYEGQNKKEAISIIFTLKYKIIKSSINIQYCVYIYLKKFLTAGVLFHNPHGNVLPRLNRYGWNGRSLISLFPSYNLPPIDL